MLCSPMRMLVSQQALKALASSWEAAGRLRSQGGSAGWRWDAANDSQTLAPKVQKAHLLQKGVQASYSTGMQASRTS